MDALATFCLEVRDANPEQTATPWTFVLLRSSNLFVTCRLLVLVLHGFLLSFRLAMMKLVVHM